jgi:LacI family transcriptional regulator
MVTARDVAERAGTSTAVVSYVFNNGPRPVAPKTRQRVLDAAAELQYRPNALARALSAGRTFSIGIVVPHIRNPYFAALAEQLEAGTRARSHLLLIGDSGGDSAQEQSHLTSFIERQVDGIVLVSVRSQPELVGLDTAGIPVVALHRMPGGSRASSLAIDSVAAAATAAGHLVSHGYRSIGVLTGPINSPGTEEHLIGVAEATRGHRVKVEHRTSEISRYHATEVTSSWLADERPRAIYCATDEQAFGVLFAAWRAGLSVPDDLAVLGGDGTAECAVTIPPLSAIQRPVPQLATRSIELLLDASPGDGPVTITLPHELVRRESCGCI